MEEKNRRTQHMQGLWERLRVGEFWMRDRRVKGKFLSRGFLARRGLADWLVGLVGLVDLFALKWTGCGLSIMLHHDHIVLCTIP